jgi:DNA repair ATPase RecN
MKIDKSRTTINNYYSCDPSIVEKLNLIIQNQQKMATSISDLSAKVDALQTALDEEQAQVKEAIDKLQASVDELRAGGGTAEEREALASKIDNVITDLKGTIPDTTEPPAEGTV